MAANEGQFCSSKMTRKLEAKEMMFYRWMIRISWMSCIQNAGFKENVKKKDIQTEIVEMSVTNIEQSLNNLTFLLKSRKTKENHDPPIPLL